MPYLQEPVFFSSREIINLMGVGVSRVSSLAPNRGPPDRKGLSVSNSHRCPLPSPEKSVHRPCGGTWGPSIRQLQLNDGNQWAKANSAMRCLMFISPVRVLRIFPSSSKFDTVGSKGWEFLGLEGEKDGGEKRSVAPNSCTGPIKKFSSCGQHVDNFLLLKKSQHFHSPDLRIRAVMKPSGFPRRQVDSDRD
jgi:hypothetical protein